ncbi:hypothetical protein GGI43DRAFT_432201 [Trichoderma evansii]
MKSSVIASILAYTAIANASPVLVRSQMCDVAPAATPASAPAPLSSPSATTAIGCQQQCEADSSCQCFVFGLPPSATAPKCILFAVPASQVPAQGTNLNVFDKACAASSVPTQAPTAANPQGPANGSSSSSSNGNGAATGGSGSAANGSGSAANGSGSGAGASKQDTQGKRVNGNGAANGGNGGNGAAAANGNGSAANGNGSAANGKGAANNGNNTPNGGNGAATGSSNQNTQGTGNVCGAAPSGPSQNPPSPFQTQANVASQQACLDLCQQTDGCKSCEFGTKSANGAKQCMLFKVPAAQLPPPSNGQSLVAFDTGC